VNSPTIAPDSVGYPFLYIAQKHEMPYGRVLMIADMVVRAKQVDIKGDRLLSDFAQSEHERRTLVGTVSMSLIDDIFDAVDRENLRREHMKTAN